MPIGDGADTRYITLAHDLMLIYVHRDGLAHDLIEDKQTGTLLAFVLLCADGHRQCVLPGGHPVRNSHRVSSYSFILYLGPLLVAKKRNLAHSLRDCTPWGAVSCESGWLALAVRAL